MYDMILGPASTAVWMKGGTNGIVFHREHSRCVVGAANTTGPLSVFNYKQGDTPVPSLAAMTAGGGPANDWDTSLRETNKVNETFWATHLRICVQRVCQDNAAPGGDVVLTPAVYRQLTSRAWFKFFHVKQELPEVEGFLEDFPEAQGPEYESVGTNFFNVNNGPTHFGAAKPLPNPLMFEAKSTFIQGTFRFATDRGGITLGVAQTGLMVYLDGYRFPRPDELAMDKA